jgi:hypothetical protein
MLVFMGRSLHIIYRYAQHGLSMVKTYLTLFAFLFSIVNLSATVKGVNGISFDANRDGLIEMELNTTGLSVGSAVSGSNLNISGSVGMSYQIITTDISLGNDSGSLLFVNTSTNTVNLKLPFAGNMGGRLIKIKKKAGGYPLYITSHSNIENNKELMLTSSDNIGAGNLSLGGVASLVSDGQHWHVLEQNGLGETTLSADNMVGYWKLNEVSGNVVKDLGPYGNTGYLGYGASGSFDFSGQGNVGKFGGALEFPNSDHYLKVIYRNPTVDPFPNTAFAVSMWVNYGSTVPSAARVLFAQNNNSDLVFGGFFLRKETDHRLRLRIHTGTTPAYAVSDSSTTVLQSDTWYHVVCSYDGVRAKIYVNGTLEAETVLNQALLYNYGPGDSRTFIVGNRAGLNQACEGSLDEVQMFNRVLSDGEVQKIYVHRTHLNY